MTLDLAGRYLGLLGLERTSPGLDGLRRIVRAHVVRVPFENISKLLLYAREGNARPLTIAEFLDGIEHRDLGGTCYSCNPFLTELLKALGYDAELRGADMSRPNVHTSIRVRLDGVEYHVDVGYGAPFYEPIRVDRLPHAIPWGRYRYVFERPEGTETLSLSQFENGERRHGYVVHPPARPFEFFMPVIVASFEPSATFMQCLRIVRFFEDHSVDLHNRRLTISGPGYSREADLATLADLRRACDDLLRMPRCPVEDAVAVLERLTGAPLFGGAASV